MNIMHMYICCFLCWWIISSCMCKYVIYIYAIILHTYASSFTHPDVCNSNLTLSPKDAGVLVVATCFLRFGGIGLTPETGVTIWHQPKQGTIIFGKSRTKWPYFFSHESFDEPSKWVIYILWKLVEGFTSEFWPWSFQATVWSPHGCRHRGGSMQQDDHTSEEQSTWFSLQLKVNPNGLCGARPAYFDTPPYTTLPKQTCESYFRNICFSSEAKHFHIK